VAVSNLGSAVLKFSGVSYATDFPENAGATGDCTSSTSLATQATCTLTIDFTPDVPLDGNAFLALSESMTVTTNTLNTTATTQTLTLTGTETTRAAATPTFSLPAGTYNTVENVTITDSTPNATIYYTTDGTAPLASSTTAAYTGAIQVSATETIQAIAVAPNYVNSPVASVAYTYPPRDFTISVSPTSLTVASGKDGRVTVTITSVNLFSEIVSVSCSGTPSGEDCNGEPDNVVAPGEPSVSPVTVFPSSANAALHRNSRPLFPEATLAVALCCFGFRKRRRLQTFLLLAVSLAGLTLFTGCGPHAVTSTVTITATSGTLQHSTTFLLTVN
jgi:hypothetical protein